MNAKYSSILFMLFLLASLAMAQEAYMEINLRITSKNITVNNIEILQGQPKDYVLDYFEYYDVNIYSFKGEVLNSFKLQKDFYIYGVGIVVSEVEEILSFPYYNNIKSLEILDEKKVILNLDLSDYATCNEDGICDNSESIVTCPIDCKIAFGRKIEEKIEAQKEEVLEKNSPSKDSSLWLYLILVLFILLIVAFFFKKLTKVIKK
ncbi:MAG: hypothetical protein U9Q69_03140 [Nanoarchaeota archaeon]|nr:hypothetical protein [Nanoarchaeota archaeon]